MIQGALKLPCKQIKTELKQDDCAIEKTARQRIPYEFIAEEKRRKMDAGKMKYAVGLENTKSYHEHGRITVPAAEGFVAERTQAAIEYGELTVLARRL